MTRRGLKAFGYGVAIAAVGAILAEVVRDWWRSRGKQ